MEDPYLQSENAYQRLYAEYQRHKNIIVALDFDLTVYDYHEQGHKFPAVIQLIQECNQLGFPVVIFSGSAKERYPAIRKYCMSIGIQISGINEDLIDWHPDKSLDWSSSKIFYNILLDDRAGLNSSYKILRKLVNTVQKESVAA